MTHLTPEVHRLLADQHGVASVQQLCACGLSHRQIHHLEHVGTLERVLRGSYRTPSAPFDESARCAAVSLARSETVIAGPTAGRLWGLRRLPSDHRVHVIAPRVSNPAIASWVVPYRTNAIHGGDIVERTDGIRVTSRARTAFDLARWLCPDDLLSVIEQVAHDGRLDDAQLREVAIDWLSPQRRWADAFLRQLDRRLPGRAAESHPEVIVADRLRRAGVLGLVRQHEVDLPGHGAARFDLAVPSLRWAIEVDVHPTHDELPGRQRDSRRDEASVAIGWHVTRIDRDTYEHRLDETIDALAGWYRTIAGPVRRPA